MENSRERLVRHVQELERLEEEKRDAAAALADRFKAAKAEGYDTTTLKVVLKLRRMTPGQRQERRALEAIYMAALGMLEGDPLPDEARRRLDPEPPKEESSQPPRGPSRAPQEEAAPQPPLVEQPPLIQKDPADARQEGAAAASAGKRIYDNPYQAGDPCRAALDEGWCSQRNSNGMDVPKAFQRRDALPPAKKQDDDKDRGQGGDVERGAA